MPVTEDVPLSGEAGYRHLSPDEIARTIGRLTDRIESRFPNAGLAQTNRRLHDIALHAKARAEWIARPIVGLRIGVVILITLIVFGIAAALVGLRKGTEAVTLFSFVQALEAGINDVVLIGAAIFFLGTLENRIKRRRALDALHELRSVAHIIDMLQLTKDPDRLLAAGDDAAPRPRMTAVALGRYLDYCSEMLALTGKVAALYVQHFSDGVALHAVNEIETLTTGLSRKIWQKLMIIHSVAGE